MSIKKILILGIILSLLTVGAVSAYETTDQLVKIANDNGYTYHNNMTNLPDDDFAQNFTKDSGYVMICYKEKGNLTMEGFPDFENKTINNTKGIYAEIGGDYYFHFQHGDEIVYTRSNDMSIIEKLAIGNGDGNATANATDNATDNSSGNSSGIIGDLEKVLADNGYNDKHNESDPSYDYMFNFTKGSDYVLLSYKKDTNLSISTFDSSKFHEKTINNTKGIYGEMDGDYFFHYQHGKDIVYTRATDEGMLEKLALGN